MKLQDVTLKALAGKITWLAAAEIASVTDRTMRRLRERRPLPGMLLPIDGSQHRWLNDNTVTIRDRVWQLEKSRFRRTLAGRTVVVQEHLDGTVSVRHRPRLEVCDAGDDCGCGGWLPPGGSGILPIAVERWKSTHRGRKGLAFASAQGTGCDYVQRVWSGPAGTSARGRGASRAQQRRQTVGRREPGRLRAALRP